MYIHSVLYIHNQDSLLQPTHQINRYKCIHKCQTIYFTIVNILLIALLQALKIEMFVTEKNIRCKHYLTVLSNESKVSCSRKQRGSLMGRELTTDRYPPIMSQMRYPLHHAASYRTVVITSVFQFSSADGPVRNIKYINRHSRNERL